MASLGMCMCVCAQMVVDQSKVTKMVNDSPVREDSLWDMSGQAALAAADDAEVAALEQKEAQQEAASS
jgi:hypothetical protein